VPRNRLERQKVRILFSPNDGKMIALHAIIKKQAKIPEKDITVAENRLKKFVKEKKS